MKKAIVVLVMIVGIFTSCEPDMCEDCYTYTYSDGSTEFPLQEIQFGTDFKFDTDEWIKNNPVQINIRTKQ